MTQLDIRHFNPKRFAIAVAAAICVLVASGWALFEYGRHRSGIDFSSAKNEAAEFREAHEQLQRVVSTLREEQAVLERSRQVEREAHKHVEGTIAGLQEEISELKAELAFYRGIVTPKNAVGGLRVQSFEVAPNGVSRGYRYKLVLTQVLKNDTVARGQVSVSIEGTRAGRLSALDLADLDGSKELAYKFKYFQNFEGDLQLPDGFSPVRVTVKVNPRDQRHQPLERVFDWPAA